MKKIVKKIPFIGDVATKFYWKILSKKNSSPFPGSAKYWEQRYAKGSNSGVGSYGKFADYKAEVINGFVAENGIQSVIEFGSGDGNQLGLANYPKYLGFDVSESAVLSCRERFANDKTKEFRLINEYSGERAELILSLDVIYHLIEDGIFESYMTNLYKASERYVIIYSSNHNNNRGNKGTHVWHRKFSDWMKANAAEWSLSKHIPNKYPYKGNYLDGSFSDFYIYIKS